MLGQSPSLCTFHSDYTTRFSDLLWPGYPAVGKGVGTFKRGLNARIVTGMKFVTPRLLR